MSFSKVKGINMKCKIWILFSVLILCFPVFAENNEIENLISNYYPKHKQINNEKFIKHVKETIGEELKAATLITADFDGNKLHDYAVLLQSKVRKFGKSEKEIHVIFRQISKGKFKPYELRRQDWVGDFIHEIKPNTVLKHYDSSHSIKLKYSAIMLNYYMKSSVAYYWDEETLTFKELWLSD